MSKELVIFGNSPFINQANVPALLKRYKTMGFNHFGTHYTVDYLVFYDRYYDGHSKHSTVIVPHWFTRGDIKIAPKAGPPIFIRKTQGGHLCVGFKYFSPSLGVNWGLLNGFTTMYLVGIDHDHTETQFEHFDGETSKTVITESAHCRMKSFIYRCSRKADIYQTNPAVKDQWDLPYKDIEELYG